MPNEFNIKNGFITSGDSSVSANLNVSGTNRSTNFRLTDNSLIASQYTVGGITLTVLNTGHNGAVGIRSTSAVGVHAISSLGVSNNNLLGASVYAAGGAQTGNISLGLLSNRALITSAATGMGMLSSVMLQVDSTTQGFLPPRMTSTQRDAILSATTGLTVYQTTDNYLSLFNGTNWQNIVSPNSSGNVLIGTTTDAGYKLDVNGTARINGAFTAQSPAGGNVVVATFIGVNAASSPFIELRNTGVVNAQIGGLNGGGLLLNVGTTERMRIANTGNVLIGTTTDAGYKLDVSGTTRVIGSKGSVITDGSSTTAFLTFSGSNTVGGTGYTDFIRVTNTAAGATNPTKTLRVNNIGGLEIMNNAYTAVALSITDNGILNVGGGNTATTTSSDGTSNYLSFNANNSQIYDDGNLHIHSRAVNQSMWINTNGGQLNLLTQSPTSTGGIGSGIAIATGTLNGYVTINTGRTVTTAANYGYLTTAGAGTYPGGSQSVVISLYANNRIWGQEIDAFSDERMKNIEGEISLEDGIKLVKNLIPIKYTWKEGDDKGVKAGYSAQQVIKSGFDHLIGLIPTEGLEETIDDDGFLSPKDTQFAMNYDQVIPYHGVVIKHLLEEIENLKNEIKELKTKLK